jgi:integrase
MKLTVKSVAQLELPAKKSDHTFFDDDVRGFGLRLREGGNRTWIFRYRVGKKQRSITLGGKAVPLAVAKANAARLEARVRLGEDPAQDKQTARAQADNLLGTLIDQYIDTRKSEWRSNTLREIRRHLLGYAKPLHKLPVSAVSQLQIAKLLNQVAESSGAVSANRFRATLATLFSWIIRQGIRLSDGNIASYTEVRKEKSRERVLSETEMRAVWWALPDDDYGTILKLLLLTGARRNEIGGLRWDEVRWDKEHGDHVALPATRTKNGHAHIVPLTAPAKSLLDKHRLLGRTFVFGRSGDDSGFGAWGRARGRLDAKINGAIPSWTVHDLRRTCASGMQKLGVRVEVIERALNHVSGSYRGVAGIYQRDPMTTEVREALERWAQHVLAIVG